MKLNIILYSKNNLHHDFRLAIIIFIIFNYNSPKNIKLLYFTLDFIINCILIFFGPVFKVDFYKLQKKFTLKICICILLKFINSIFVIAFVRYNFQKELSCYFKKFLKEFQSSFNLNYKK